MSVSATVGHDRDVGVGATARRVPCVGEGGVSPSSVTLGNARVGEGGMESIAPAAMFRTFRPPVGSKVRMTYVIAAPMDMEVDIVM